MVSADAVDLRFGELTVHPCGEATVIGVPGATNIEVESDPAALRAWVATDDLGRYRPLSGYRSLRRGWSIACGPLLTADEALDIVYPLARRHREAWQRGDLRVVPLDEALNRQSGRYASASDLSESGRKAASDVLCAGCVRTPVWRGDALPPDGIPCPEACSVLVALCREAARWERGIDAEPAPVSSEAGFADFEAPGNEVREAVLARLALQAEEAD